MIKHEIKIAFTEYNSLAELDTADQIICREAVKAMEHSHSPYSKFKVGAALLLESGKVIRGSNQENAAYPSGLCAERTALFNWGANHPDDPIQTIAITAHTDNFDILKPVTPCGSCLQVMAEYEKKQGAPLKIILYCIDGPVWVTTGVASFLPFMFFEERLVAQ
ncbi:cytidine deaminase [Mucilaginibacter myungsuensis]|uniref:Cytidine deaminase n=1 Tax=Mucilaginibacter myungsuensis TaxID=649104 RepID=A0A929PXT2_9SPHI|nr:cytidine deaminase [Mucilaginibacter myungsuensis]MBE9662602.1 cytidine deaminase [Mucilaginibacter myungsuensis]MDN3598022.1 cytidine deaminase [Mucilaginibacter myungsuensis]